MALENVTKMLQAARQGKYAVGQFNINNLEWTQTILDTANELKAPVILGVSEGAAKYMGGFKTITGMVYGYLQDKGYDIPVAIHLDYGTSFESCKAAIDAGFTSVMIDGSHGTIDHNIQVTKEVVDYAHAKGVSVEAEVGTVGWNEDGIVGGISYADFDECKRIVAEGNIDALAPALGSVHGEYEGEPKLGFTEMKEIGDATEMPLVLHGGSGIPDDQIQKAISCGTAKINVNSEIQWAFAKAIRELLANDSKSVDPRKIVGPTKVQMAEVVKAKIELFGCANKAA